MRVPAPFLVVLISRVDGNGLIVGRRRVHSIGAEHKRKFTVFWPNISFRLFSSLGVDSRWFLSRKGQEFMQDWPSICGVHRLRFNSVLVAPKQIRQWSTTQENKEPVRGNVTPSIDSMDSFQDICRGILFVSQVQIMWRVRRRRKAATLSIGITCKIYPQRTRKPASQQPRRRKRREGGRGSKVSALGNTNLHVQTTASECFSSCPGWCL